MIQIIWEYQVDSLQAAAFEKIYGSRGEWALLFQQSKDYHGTTLLKDNTLPNRYLTIDKWTTIEAFENFKVEHHKAYSDLDHKCEKLTKAEKKLGVFGNI